MTDSRGFIICKLGLVCVVAGRPTLLRVIRQNFLNHGHFIYSLVNLKATKFLTSGITTCLFMLHFFCCLHIFQIRRKRLARLAGGSSQSSTASSSSQSSSQPDSAAPSSAADSNGTGLSQPASQQIGQCHFLPLSCSIYFLGNIKVYSIHIFYSHQHQDGTGSSNPSQWKTRTC